MENIEKLKFFHKIMKKKKSSEKNKNTLFFFTGRKFFLYCGLTYDHTWISALNIVRFSVIATIGLLHVLLEILFNYEAHDFLTLVELSHYLVMAVYSLAIYVALFPKSSTFNAFCDLLNQEFAFPKEKLSPKQEEIRRNTSKFVQKFKRITSILFIWGISAACVRRPIFDRKTKFTTLYEGWVPFVVNSWPRYIIVCITQLMISINAPFAMYSCLIAFVAEAKQLCCQSEILSVYIKETFEYSQPDNVKSSKKPNIIREKFIQARLKCAIERHHLLIRCFNTFQDIYNAFLFVLTLSSGVIICTVIYMITDPKSTASLIAEFISLLVPEITIIACYCWAGQQMSDQWSQMRDAIYDVNWYNESITTQKSLLNMLICCTKDQIITAAGLQEFSMQGFSELLQASFSYFNMLKALR